MKTILILCSLMLTTALAAVPDVENIFAIPSSSKVTFLWEMGELRLDYGTSGSGVGKFNAPFAFHPGSNGKIYIADTGNNRIVKVDNLNGTGWTAYGSAGSGVGKFSSPSSIYYDGASDTVLVSDTGNNRIVSLSESLNGTGWTTYGSQGSGSGNFSSPASICKGADSKIYIADFGNSRIVQINNISGAGWTTFGGPGTGTGKLGAPLCVQVAGNGKIYIADTGNSRIVRIDDMTGSGWVSYGHSGSNIDQFTYPRGVFAGADNLIYVADTGNDRLVRINNMSGDGWKVYTPAYPDGFAAPSSVQRGNDGRLLITDMNNARVVGMLEIADILTVSIVRRSDRMPRNATDGEVVYIGTDTSYIDTGLQSKKKYYWAVYVLDDSNPPSYSSGYKLEMIVEPYSREKIEKYVRLKKIGGEISDFIIKMGMESYYSD